MHNQTFLDQYFRTHWRPGATGIYSSYPSIAKKINAQDWVLDVGCGDNQLKSLLPNVVGIDPANSCADYATTIEQFQPPRLFDVALCLGSINFGDRSTIQNQIECMVRCLQPRARVFWRMNPGAQDHASDQCKKIVFYPWTHAESELFARAHGFEMINPQVELTGNRIRLYCEWVR
jgi:hypothetical protein